MLVMLTIFLKLLLSTHLHCGQIFQKLKYLSLKKTIYFHIWVAVLFCFFPQLFMLHSAVITKNTDVAQFIVGGGVRYGGKELKWYFPDHS